MTNISNTVHGADYEDKLIDEIARAILSVSMTGQAGESCIIIDAKRAMSALSVCAAFIASNGQTVSRKDVKPIVEKFSKMFRQDLIGSLKAKDMHGDQGVVGIPRRMLN